MALCEHLCMTYFEDKQPTPRVLRVLKETEREAHRQGHSYIGTQHLLLGLLRRRTNGSAWSLVT